MTGPRNRVGWAGVTALAVLLAVLAAGCGGGSKKSSSGTTTSANAGSTSNLPQSIGKGEGKLNLVAWEGYAQDQWVKPFQTQTGCQVHAQVRGLVRRDGDADAPGRRVAVRHGLGLGRREPAPDRAATSRR